MIRRAECESDDSQDNEVGSSGEICILIRGGGFCQSFVRYLPVSLSNFREKAMAKKNS